MTHTMLATDHGAEGWWSEFDTALLDYLAPGGSISPAEIGRRRNLAEDAVSSFLSMTVRECRITTQRVAWNGGAS
jgi:hypothetical protein